jgi:hypothetical protein
MIDFTELLLSLFGSVEGVGALIVIICLLIMGTTIVVKQKFMRMFVIITLAVLCITVIISYTLIQIFGG